MLTLDNLIIPQNRPAGANGSRDPENGRAPYRLTEGIIALSVADTWGDAKREWELESVFFTEPGDYGTCLCGHAIREHCVLTNRVNGNVAVVGNVCVMKFLGLDAEELFAAFRKIVKNPEAALSTKAIDYAYEHAWINDWERCFCLTTCRKSRPKLSPSQLKIRCEINAKIIGRLTEREGRDHA
jgi:hypothetical protein